MSVGIQDSTEELVEQARQYLNQSYPKIKMKIKSGLDLDRVDAMRKAFPDINLMVDANNAYSMDDMVSLKRLDEYNLLMIE